MKLTKHYPLDDEHTAIVEVDNRDVIIYIEKSSKRLWGLLDWGDRVSSFHVFTLIEGLNNDRGVEIQRFIHGYLGRYQLKERNLEAFDVQKEISVIFKSYLERKKRDNAFNNRLNLKLESL